MSTVADIRFPLEFSAHISFRHDYTGRKVAWMKFVRYLQTGYLLHLMAISSVVMFIVFGRMFLQLMEEGAGPGRLILTGYAGTYFFTLIFFSQLDARSRFQNYKMVKDKFFQYGFDARLLRPFVYSRCQRDAIGVAARELEFRNDWKALTRILGFRWYHLLPDIIIKKPWVLFSKTYWKKTLFVKTYHSKYFLW